MGGWNRSWRAKSRYDGSGGHSHPRPPPPDSGYDHGSNNHCPVPLWEREFCCWVGGISWQRFCENKRFIEMYKDIEQWDDSAAFENFQNIKSRFWANYHGQPSDIPLPDPDMYIDKVDHRCKVDHELVADLDKIRIPFETDNESSQWGNTEADNKCTPNQSGNWDIYLEKPAEVNKWEDNSRSNLGWGTEHEPLNAWSKNSWEIKHEPLNSWSKNRSGWGDALVNGWGDALVNPSWGSSSNNHYSSNNRNSSYGVANNTCHDPSSTYGRKRNNGGYSEQRNSKQRNQAEGYQRGRWQGHRGRNNERFPYDNRPNGQRAERGF